MVCVTHTLRVTNWLFLHTCRLKVHCHYSIVRNTQGYISHQMCRNHEYGKLRCLGHNVSETSSYYTIARIGELANYSRRSLEVQCLHMYNSPLPLSLWNMERTHHKND